jgi:hypothetical protein
MSTASTGVALTAGQSTAVTIDLARTAYSGSVTLSATGLPSGVTATFAPNGTTGNSVTMTLSASAGAGNGTTSATIKATTVSGPTVQSLTVPISVVAASNVRLSAQPASRTINAGQSTTVTINLARTNFTGTVTLAATGTIANAVTASFAPASITGSSSTLTLTTAAAASGTYWLSVSGTASGATVVPTVVALTVVPASGVVMTATPASATVTQSQQASYTVNLARNNFTGSISLAVSNLPAGASYSFNPAATTGNTSTLSVYTSSQTAVGSFYLTITATASGVTIAPVTVQLTVNPLRVIAQARKECYGGNSAFTISYIQSNGTITSTQHRFSLAGSGNVFLRWSAHWFQCQNYPWNLANYFWYIKAQGGADVGSSVPTTATDQTMSLAAGNWEINLTETITAPGDYYVLSP